ncbi:MAG: universal stress protein [Burkholderiales bacterium]|nr:universal stress protein [Burkholderiales bacterium]
MTAARPILAATDFSERAGMALERAAQCARQIGAPLVLLHVVERYHLDALQRLAQEAGALGGADWPARARAELERHASRIAQTHGVAVDTEVRIGRVFEEIAESAAARAAELTVIGAHGEHFLRDLLLGATAQKAVRRNPGSTLVVRRGGSAPYGHVLVPVDFSPDAAAALAAARRLAPEARLHVLHAYELPFEGKLFYAGVAQTVVDEYCELAEREAERELAAFLAGAGAAELASARVVHGHAPDVVVKEAARRDADLVAIGAHGRSELSYFMLGSVSLHVVLEAQCDVLVAKRPGP